MAVFDQTWQMLIYVGHFLAEIPLIIAKYWVWSGAEERKPCSSQKCWEINVPRQVGLRSKVGFDTAETEAAVSRFWNIRIKCIEMYKESL